MIEPAAAQPGQLLSSFVAVIRWLAGGAPSTDFLHPRVEVRPLDEGGDRPP